jgi:hypothetical protein
MNESIVANEWFEYSINAYAKCVHKRFSKDGFERQRAAWNERDKMLKYFETNPPSSDSMAGAYCEDVRWLDDGCVDSWRLGNEKIEIIRSDRIEIADTELWQVTYKADIEPFAYFSVVLYSKDGVKHVSTYLIEEV